MNLSSSIQWELASDYLKELPDLKKQLGDGYLIDSVIENFKKSHQLVLFEETCNFAIAKIRSNPYTSPEEHFQTLRSVSELFLVIGMLLLLLLLLTMMMMMIVNDEIANK